MNAPPRATLRFAEKRELILDGAARLFNRRGIKAGTLAEVAATARQLIASLTTTAEPRNRETEAAKARARSAARFGGAAGPG